MVNFNIFTVLVYLSVASKVLECRTESFRNRCPPIWLNNGRVKLRSSGRVARISCSWPYMLIQGNEITTCVRGKWDEYPICACSGCDTTLPQIANGRLIVSYNGAKIEVQCDPGYTVDGPSFTYCAFSNQHLEWNENIKGCKQLDEIYFSCDFESSDERFCGWQNDNFNDVDWLADKTSSLFFSTRRHVVPGSSQYFTNNYISLDAGNYGSSTSGRLLSPNLGPVTNKQRCLIFSYKVTDGSSRGKPTLTVNFGGIPHWSTSKGEGKVIIGLYKLNVNSKIVIEGKNCRAAIDNLIIANGHSCTQQPYEEELDTCTDNCGIIISDESRCSCDWECQSNNNCCPDIKQKCPYIKSSDQISKLYFTTTVIPSKITTLVNIDSYNVTIPSVSTSSKSINESKISNDSSLLLTINEHNITSTETMTITMTTPTTISTIPTSNVTYPTFPPTPPTISTIKPITETVTIPSTTASIETSNITVTLNHAPFFLNTQNTMNISSIQITSSMATWIEDNSTSAPKLNNTTYSTSYSIMTNTTPTLINISNSTVKTPSVNKFLSIAKLMKLTNAIVKSSKENTTSKSPTLMSTAKPIQYWSSIISSYIYPNKSLLTEHSPDTTFVYITNQSSSNQPKLISSPVANTTDTIEKNIKTTTISMLPNTFNIPTIILKQSNFTKFITELPNIQKTIENSTTTKNKSITSKSTMNDNFSKSTNIPNNKFIFFDSYHTNSQMAPLKYDTVLNNKYSNVSSNVTYGIPNITTQPTSRINYLSNISRKNVNSTTTTEISHAKLELNFTLHNQHKQNVDTWLAEHVKQNDKAKKSSFAFDTFAIIIKFITVVGIIFITLKYTFSIIIWYFKKPAVDDEMNTFFVTSDNDGLCNMELTPNPSVE